MRTRASQRPYNVEYYRRNRDLELQRVRVRQTGMVELLRDLRRVPCADCGGQFKPHQMDFDHRDPATKSFNVMSGHAMLMATAEGARRGRQVRHRVCQLPSDSDAGGSGSAASTAFREIPVLGTSARRWRDQAALLKRLRDVPCMDCGGASELRDGVRSPRSTDEDAGRHADDRPGRYAANHGRGREVRYRVRELPSGANVRASRWFQRAGVAQLAERRPSKPHVAGSIPVSRSNSSPEGRSTSSVCSPRRGGGRRNGVS